MKRRSGYVQIHVGELLDEVDDDALLDEVHARKLSPASPGETCDLDIVREAYEALQRNSVPEARAILDRPLFPKWRTAAKCNDEYQLVLGAHK